MKVKLTERDKSILTDLARCRVLSFMQISAMHFPHAKERTCRERLEKLVKAGYLGKTTVPAEKAVAWLDVYYLEKKGKRWATGPEGGFDSKYVFANPGKYDEILHQVRTNEVYLMLTENEKATWKIGDVLEIELGTARKGSDVCVPDAVFSNESGSLVYVEADTGCYTASQIRERAAAFSGIKGIKTIWTCPTGRKGFLIRHGARGKFITYSVA